MKTLVAIVCLVVVCVVGPASATLGDADDDGLTDAWEAFWGTNPLDPDTDHDGLEDRVEVGGLLQWGIGAPTDADADDDGLDDGHDDYDADGVANLDELALGSSLYQPDSDFDGLDDGQEPALGFDLVKWDTDGDGVCDGDTDGDGDGLGVARELALATQPADSDSDDDGVDDGTEAALGTDPLLPDASGNAFRLVRTPGGTPDWKLYQRDADGRATIPLRFRYRSDRAMRIEAAVVDAVSGAALLGHGFADHVTTVSTGAAPLGAEGTLEIPNVPQGGNYDVVVRAVDPASGALVMGDTARSLAVGDVFLAAGQSNMSGESGWWEPPSAMEAPDPRVHLFGNDYHWKVATEPMDDPADSVDAVSIDGLARSSPMLRFAKEIARRTGIPIAVIPASHLDSTLVPAPPGPSNANGWARDPIAPSSRTTLYGSAISRVLVQGYAQPIRGIIWYQGESDSTQAVDAYRTALESFVADLRGDLASPGLFVAICQLSWAGTTNPERLDGWMRIREAQRQYVSSDPQSVLVATIDLPSDGLHLFGPGHREAGRRLGLATLRASYGLRSDAPPKLRWTRLQRGASRITLKYDRRLIGGNPMLFRVHEADVDVAIVAVTTRGARVKIDLERAVGDGARVTYSAGSSGDAPVAPLVGARGEGAVPLFQDLGVALRLP